MNGVLTRTLTLSAVVKTGLGGRRKVGKERGEKGMDVERQGLGGFSARGQGFNCEGEAWEAFAGTLFLDYLMCLPIVFLLTSS